MTIVPTLSPIRRAQSLAPDARDAVRELHVGIAQPDMALVVFFCSSRYDLDALALEIRHSFADTLVVGCTTAGEIGPAGYLDHSLSGVSFGASHFQAASALLPDLQTFDIGRGRTFALELMHRLSVRVPGAMEDSSFAVQLIDGLSIREEPVTRTLQSVLGRIPLIGGSAGDGDNFGQAHVFSDGRFHRDVAVLTLIHSALPFRPVRTNSFAPSDERMVVTRANPAQRIVHEINGRPAANEFARAIGVAVEALDIVHFARWSAVVMINGVSHVRSIQRVNGDGSLQFFCAIENGLVLRIAHSVGMRGNLHATFAELRQQIGPPQLVLGADCMHRKMEAHRNGLIPAITGLFEDNRVSGFSSYGEQFRGIHLNQTFVGIGIGSLENEPTYGRREDR